MQQSLRNVCCARSIAEPSGGRRRPPPLGDREAGAGYAGRDYLKASLTFSPACLRSAPAWSALPSASSRSSSVALPVVSLTLPLASCAAFEILSSSPMGHVLSHRECLDATTARAGPHPGRRP